MAIPGLRSSLPLHSNCLFTSPPFTLTLPPSTFKIEASTAQFTATHELSSSNHRTPQPNSPKKRQHLSTFDESLRLLDQVMADVTASSGCCRQVHARVLKVGLMREINLVANKMVVAYLKCEEPLFDDARKVFDEMSQRTVRAYATLIGSYCRLAKWVEVFSVLERMINDGFMPDKYLVPTILKACSAMEMVKFDKMVHGFVIRREFGEDVVLGNVLIDMYANCGDLRCSERVFDAMNERDVVSWTALIEGYMSQGLLNKAIDVFHSMQFNGVKTDLISWNTLVYGFARNGEIELALKYLEEMHERGIRPQANTWNGIISGCVQNDCYEDALDAFLEMLETSEGPNAVTIVSILPACSALTNLNLGEGIHGLAIKFGFCGNTHVVGSLIDMYSKCGRNDYAEMVFVRVKHKSTAIWNEMIAGYVNEGKVEVAMELLGFMKDNGLKPDEITYNTILAAHARQGKKNEAYELLYEMRQTGLQPNIITMNVLISGFQQSGLSQEALKLFMELTKINVRPNSVTITGALGACADLDLLRHGKELHGYIIRNNLESNIFVSSALVDMYAKCRDMYSAVDIFWRLKNKNTVSWNTLMAGYVNNGRPEVALSLFNIMLNEEHKPSVVTFTILLLACGEISALYLGRALHGCVAKGLFDESNYCLSSALIDMYAKCGSIVDAKLVFDSDPYKDVAIRNSILFNSQGEK